MMLLFAVCSCGEKTDLTHCAICEGLDGGDSFEVCFETEFEKEQFIYDINVVQGNQDKCH